ncbi:MAG: tetratricopeptide repeat protein [Pseudomonadota bacterium]
MALQQFVKNSETVSPNENVRGNNQPHDRNEEPVNAQPVKTSALLLNHASSGNVQAVKAPGITSPENLDVNLQSSRPKLDVAERETLLALAAVQIRYGRPAEAVPYLMMVRKTNPEDINAARLLARALMKLGRWEQADFILQEIEAHSENTNDEAASGFTYLYRSIIAMKVRKLSDARAWLDKFRNFMTRREQ